MDLCRAWGIRWGVTVLALGMSMNGGAAEREWASYTVRPGDTIWTLTRHSLDCLCRVQTLMDMNGIRAPLQLAPGTVLKVPSAWLKRIASQAAVEHVSGEVMWSVSSDRPMQALVPGATIGAPAVVQTASNGQCALRLPDGSLVLIRPDSLVRLQTVTRTGLVQGLSLVVKVERGTIENRVQPRKPGGRFQVDTPSAVATVRGTDFTVSAHDAVMRTAVLGGAVQVRNGQGAQHLPAGTGLAVATGVAPSRPIALLPAPAASAVPNVIERFPVVVELPVVAGVKGYRTQWQLGGAAAKVVTERVAVRPTLIGDGVPDGRHTLRIRALDDHGLEGLPLDVTVQVHRRPDPPIYLGPLPDVVLQEERPDITWAQGSTREVRLQVASDPEFGQPWIDATVSNDGRTAMLKAITAGVWYWRMASIDDKGEPGPWGPTQRLTRQPAPPQANPPTKEADHLVMRWEPVPGALRYEVSLSDVGHGDAAKVHVVEKDAYLALPDDLPPGQHEVSVRALLAHDVASQWSAPQRFTVERKWPWWPALLLLIPLAL